MISEIRRLAKQIADSQNSEVLVRLFEIRRKKYLELESAIVKANKGLDKLLIYFREVQDFGDEYEQRMSHLDGVYRDIDAMEDERAKLISTINLYE